MARFPKSVSPGDPIPTGSEAWNAILGAAHEHRQASRPDAPPRAGGFGGVVWALGLNDTGANLPKHKPVAATGVGGLDVSGSDPDDDGGPPWQRRPLLTLSEPAAVTDWVCVTLDAIPAGEIGRVAVSGLTLCDVDSASGATWAAPQIGSTDALLGGTTGTVRVLDVPAGGSSQRRCLVYLHERPGAGQACGVTPSVRRELIGVYQVKTGSNVTDVYQRFQDVTTDANGCESRGEPYCVVAPSSCGTGPREVDYYCISGVCWAYYDGLVPASFDDGPFASAALCDAGCPVSPPPAAPTCAEADAGNLPSTLTATIDATAGLCGEACQPGDWSGTTTLTRLVGNTWDNGSYEDPCPGVSMNITLQCVDGVFYLSWGGGGSFQASCPGGSGDCEVAATTGTVSPFSLTFETPVCCVCDATTPGSTVTVVVTE